MSLLNQNRAISLYMATIALIGTVVFIVFFLANMFATQQNAALIEEMQNREFPMISTLIDLREDAATLKRSLSEAITFENEFLISESQENARILKARIARLIELNGTPMPYTDKMETALAEYTNQASILATSLISSTESLDQFTQQAEKTNQAFDRLQEAIDAHLEFQQEAYANQLVAVNTNLGKTTTTATLIGLLLLATLFGFTAIITRKILSAVKRADTLKEVFLTTISHELRTPLTGIFGAFNLLATTPGEADQQELIALGQTASRAMNKIVDDIILFAELMSGQNTVIESEFSVQTALSEILKLTEAKCQEKGLSFEYNIPEATLKTDERKLTRSLGHLLENAVKYTEQGTVKLTIHRIPVTKKQSRTGEDDPQRDLLQAIVEDSGPGIEPHYLSHIFLPFEQGDSNWNRQHQGMGLGLPMSHLMITNLSGDLTITNRQESHGVRAEIRIPCHFTETVTIEVTTQADVGVGIQNPLPTAVSLPSTVTKDESCQAADNHTCQKSHQNTRRRNTGQDEPIPSSNKNTISHVRTPQALVIEGNKTNQFILQMILRKLNISSVLANDASTGLGLLTQRPFDIVFIDCQLPDLKEFDINQQIRKRPTPYGTLPIIGLTTKARGADTRSYLAEGMNGVIVKPVNLNTVKKSLAEHIELR